MGSQVKNSGLSQRGETEITDNMRRLETEIKSHSHEHFTLDDESHPPVVKSERHEEE